MNRFEFVNLTPHRIDEVSTGRSFEPSGDVARVGVEYIKAGEINGIPVYEARYGSVEGLPEPRPGKVFIVSGMVLSHPRVSARTDVVAPGELVRDESGKPTGCQGFKKG